MAPYTHFDVRDKTTADILNLINQPWYRYLKDK
jgi:hypothetical protein